MSLSMPSVREQMREVLGREMAHVDIDRPAPGAHLLQRAPHHHVARRLVAHRMVVLHERLAEAVDEFAAHAEESVEAGRAEALRHDGQAHIFDIGELDADIEGGAVQVAGIGRAIPEIERVAGLALEHAVGVAGGDDHGFGLDFVEIAIANVIAGKARELAVVQIEIAHLHAIDDADMLFLDLRKPSSASGTCRRN